MIFTWGWAILPRLLLEIEGSRDCPNFRFSEIDKNWDYRGFLKILSPQNLGHLFRRKMKYVGTNLEKALLAIPIKNKSPRRPKKSPLIRVSPVSLNIFPTTPRNSGPSRSRSRSPLRRSASPLRSPVTPGGSPARRLVVPLDQAQLDRNAEADALYEFLRQ